MTSLHKSVNKEKKVRRSSIFQKSRISGTKATPSVLTLGQGAKPRTPGVSRENRKKWDEQVAGVLKKQWKMCTLSSMHKFLYSNANIHKAYASRLEKSISAVYVASKIEVSIVPTSFLEYNVSQTDALIITVTALNYLDEDETVKTIYTAILVHSKGAQSKRNENIDWWPLMLFNGAQKIHFILISFLTDSFGCFIVNKYSNATILHWIFAIHTYTDCENDKRSSPNAADDGSRISIPKHDKCTLKYSVNIPMGNFMDPNSYKHIAESSVTVSLKKSRLKRIWESIIGPNEKEITTDNLGDFYRKFDEKTFQSYLNINKSCLNLTSINTPCVATDINGALKFHCVEMISEVLQRMVYFITVSTHSGRQKLASGITPINTPLNTPLQEVESESEQEEEPESEEEASKSSQETSKRLVLARGSKPFPSKKRKNLDSKLSDQLDAERTPLRPISQAHNKLAKKSKVVQNKIKRIKPGQEN